MIANYKSKPRLSFTCDDLHKREMEYVFSVETPGELLEAFYNKRCDTLLFYFMGRITGAPMYATCIANFKNIDAVTIYSLIHTTPKIKHAETKMAYKLALKFQKYLNRDK